nr:uncharacterized protein LOC100213206 [Hydra vulgaris]
MSLLEGGDRRRYNLPSHDEVAVVFVGEDGAPPISREVVIYQRGHPLKIVSSKVVTHAQVIEFQKRGLPHAHILLHLANDDKLETSQDIDNLICAEIPDPIVNCELYDIIKTCMIHGPCGILNPNSPCIKDGVCSKKYPKGFNANTVAVHNGYPRYRRRDNGLVINIKGNNVDNRWVVPYNPWLSKKYQAHINVEACMSVKAVKYLYKYIYKGHDCANVLINEQVNHDEIDTFLDCRYVSAPEALWRIFEYPMLSSMLYCLAFFNYSGNT